ncbi:MAG: HlyC/CorC family transporter [Alphaproteobacteria bacterium]|nr:HlyC/CorC family transporter [Alphaproteobacteria bacterium]
MIATGGGAGLEIGSPWAAAAVFVALFALSFFFSGTETAFFSLQGIDRRRIAEGRTATHRRIHGLLSRRTALITTILMGNETVNVAISATAAALLATVAPGKPWLTIVVVTPVLVLLSEITPKVLAYRFNRGWVDVAVWPLTLLFWVLWPLRIVITGIVSALARLAGVTGAAHESEIGEDEFLVLVERGAEHGVVGEEEREIIEAVFELDDLPVSRLMTPRPDMFSLPIDVTWDDLLAACADARFSRVPMYDGTPDNIVGVLLVKDLLRHRRRPFTQTQQLRKLLMAPVFVPQSKPANHMMKEMIRRRIHMAFVVDEHGTVIGLVSLDDLIIELVGELGDEFTDEGPDDISPDGLDAFTVRAGMDLEDFSEGTGIAVPEGDYHTLAGFVSHVLGRIPVTGDTVDAAGHRFEVTEMDGRRVAMMRVAPIDTAQDDGDREVAG